MTMHVSDVTARGHVGREMNDVLGPRSANSVLNCIRITQVTVATADTSDFRSAVSEPRDEMRANKARRAGDQNSQIISSNKYCGRPFTSSKMRPMYRAVTPKAISMTPAKNNWNRTRVVNPCTGIFEKTYSSRYHAVSSKLHPERSAPT